MIKLTFGEPQFPLPLVLAYVPHSDGKFVLVDDFKYVDDCGTEWLAWKGMETDGGSVPDLFEGWFRPFGYGLAGFVIHDALCLSKEVSRSEANRVLKEILYKLGDLKSIDVEMIYYAVEAYRLKMGLD